MRFFLSFFRARRGRSLLVPLLAAAALAAAFLSGALAGVSTNGLFQLDGNSLVVDSNTASTAEEEKCATGAQDWSALWAQSEFNPANASPSATPCGSEGFTFVNDKVGKEGDTTYWSGGGSKDAYDPSLGQWQWASNDVSPDKNDIVNAFAAKYQDSSKNSILYFGDDRFATNGDAQMGFWFLQEASCLEGPVGETKGNCPESLEGGANAGKFVNPKTGQLVKHKNKDILVLVNYNKGGTIGLSGIYEWQKEGTGKQNGEAALIVKAEGADCKEATTTANFCAIASKEGALLKKDPIWPFKTKSGSSEYEASSFMEGGVNLSALGLGSVCFPTFIAETRSSSGPETGLSLQAQLKDLAFGKFQSCTSETKTTPENEKGEPIKTVSIGTGTVNVKDSAEVTVKGAETWSGKVTFYLCGPLASGTCDGVTNLGAKIGEMPVSNSENVVTSPAVTITSVGRYCWRGVFTDGEIPGSKDSSEKECFTVTPVPTKLETESLDKSPVEITKPVHDKATLTGTATEPLKTTIEGTEQVFNLEGKAGEGAKGTITFKLYGPSTSGCGTLAEGFPTGGIEVKVNKQVNGSGEYTAEFTPKQPGTYHWVAEYSGDSPNTEGSTHNLKCEDAKEDVTVEQPTETTTRQFVFPQDKAKIALKAGSGSLEGSVRFRLYDGEANCKAGGTTGLLYEEAGTAHPIKGSSPQFATTNNTGKAMNSETALHVYWNVVYESKNAQKGSSSACVENTEVKFAGDDATIEVPKIP
jgi:hypothetical protein